MPTQLYDLWSSVRAFLRNLMGAFIENKCQRSAAALTYMTLFALVPVTMLMYSMFSLIPAFEGVGDQLQSWVFASFLPDAGAEVQQHLTAFSQQARNLTLPGVLILVVTAYLMLSNIEKTFNAIWGVTQARRGLTSFLIYWAVLSIGPLFLGAGLIMSTYILSLKMVVGDVDILSAVSPMFRVIPPVMSAFAFTLLFTAVPNCRVPLKEAFIGGIVTALCFEAAKTLFTSFVANSNFQLIYGAFAVVPLFLIWINFMWIIVLAGAVLVRTLAEKEFARGVTRQPDFVAILQCLSVFRNKTRTGESVTDRDCVQAGVGLVHWHRLCSLLIAKMWIAVTDNGHYVLTRDLSQVTLWDLAGLVDVPVTQKYVSDRLSEEWFLTLQGVQEQIYTHSQDALSTTLDQFFTGKDLAEK